MGSKGKNKAQNKARNKAKRSGVVNPAAAASSAAAAAAAHVAADIEADQANVGVPVTTAEEQAQPENSSEPAEVAAESKENDLSIADSNTEASEETVNEQAKASSPGSAQSEAVSSPKNDTDSHPELKSTETNGSKDSADPQENAAVPLPESVAMKVKAAEVESVPSEASLKFTASPATPGQTKLQETQPGETSTDQPESSAKGSEEKTPAAEPSNSVPSGVLSSDAVSPKTKKAPGDATNVGEVPKSEETEEASREQPIAGVEKTTESTMFIDDALHSNNLNNLEGPADDEFYKSLTAAGSAAKSSAKSVEDAKVVTKEASRDIEALGAPFSKPGTGQPQASESKSKHVEGEGQNKNEAAPSEPYTTSVTQLSDLDPSASASQVKSDSGDEARSSEKVTERDHQAAEEACLAAEIAKTESSRELSPLETDSELAPDTENANKRSTHDSGSAETSQTKLNVDEAASQEEDEFYKSILAAGREAQHSNANIRHEQEATDENELDAELERDQEQEAAFDQVVTDRRAREAEIREECEALENYKEAISEGVADAAEDEIEAREAEIVANREALVAKRLSEEVEAEERYRSQNHEAPNQHDDHEHASEEGDFYGALAGSEQTVRSPSASHAQRPDSEIAPEEIIESPAVPYEASLGDSGDVVLDADDFYRSLSNGGPSSTPSGRLHTEEFGEERVNSDFDGTIGKPESIGGGSSSHSLSSVSPGPLSGDDFFSAIQSEVPSQPSAPSIPLNLELDDDFLDDESSGEKSDDEETPKGSAETVEEPAKTHKASTSLSFLESDDDLLPEDDEETPAAAIAANTITEPASVMVKDAFNDQVPSTSETPMLKPKPSMTEFHTDKQGFDLPLEILPQPQRRHAPQRVGSRTGTPRGSVSTPQAAQAPPQGIQRGSPSIPVSPPRSVPPPQARALPSRAPSRTQSATASSRYQPSATVPQSVPPHVQPPRNGTLQGQTHTGTNMFVNDVPPQNPSHVSAHPRPGPPPPASRPIAPRPAPNPDPYGFPGLSSVPPRRVSSRASSTSLRRAGSAGATAPASGQYQPGTSPAVTAPPVTAPPMSAPPIGAPPMGAAPPPVAAAAPPHVAEPPRTAGAPPRTQYPSHHAPSRSSIPSTAISPAPGSPRENISPRTVVRPPSNSSQRVGSLTASGLPPLGVTPPSAGPVPPQYSHPLEQQQFGGPLNPVDAVPPVAPVSEPRSRYTPSPLNVPVALVGHPRGDHPEEQLLKRQRNLFSWSSHAWVKITPEAQFGASGASVHTGETKSLSIIPEAAMSKFPLPLVNAKGAIKSKKKEVEKWIDSVVAAEGQERQNALLYSVLKQLLGPEESRDAGVRDVLRGQSVHGFGSQPHVPEPAVPSTAPVPELLNKLGEGDRAGAMQAALDSRNYAHALVIAHALGGDHWQIALNEFVAEEVRRQDPQLAFVYRALAAGDAVSGGAALSELKPRGQTALVDFARVDANLERWADAATALYGAGAAANAALAELGALLVERGRVAEGHTCFILAGIVPGTTPQFSLPLMSVKGSPSFDSFVLAEIYEYIIGRNVPALLAPKVAFAGLLADSGYITDAQRVAENAVVLAKAIKAHPKLTDQASRMVARCSAAAPVQGTWLQRKLSRPNLERKWVSSFNKFVSGDDDEPEPPRPQSAGMPGMPDAVPQRQSYTPGPYSGRPDSAPSSASASLGGEFTPAHTPIRPAPINEDEEYGGGALGSHYNPQHHYQQQYPVPGSHGPYDPQQYGSLPMQGHGGHGAELYSSRPPSQNAYLSRPSSAGSFGAANGMYTPSVMPLSGTTTPGGYMPQAVPQVVPQTLPQQTQPAQGPYAPPVPQGPYAPQPAPGSMYNQQPPPAAAPNRYAPQPASEAPPPEAAPEPIAAEPPATESAPLPETDTQSGSAKKPEPEPEKSDETKEQPKKKGWLSWLKKEDPNEIKPIKVKLGSEAKLVYDKELKRWIKEGEPRPEPRKGPPPPPKAAVPSQTPSTGSPAPVAQPGAPAAPGTPGTPAAPGAPAAPAPATAPGMPSSGVPQPAAATPPTAAVPAPPVTGGIDGILAASASASTARKKRPARSRYVNVTDSGLPEGMTQ